MPIENSATNPFGEKTDRDISTATDDSAESGTSQGELALWDKTMEEKYDFVSQISSDYWSNESKYEVFDSPGILSPTWGKYDQLYTKLTNYSAEGTILDTDGTDLDGYVSLITPGGEVATSKAVSGPFLVALGPPIGSRSGSDITFDGNYKVVFEPNLDGISASSDLTGNTVDFGTVQYSRVAGKVTDSEGNSVNNVAISASGGKTLSDNRGRYTLLGPGGTVATFTSLNGYTKDVELVAGEYNVVDWQYAGVYLTISLPGGINAVGVPVELSHNGELRYTDEDGEVKFTEVPPGLDGEYKIFDEIVKGLTSGTEGFVDGVNETVGAGVRGIVSNANSGKRVAGVSVEIEADGKYAAETGEGGKYATGSDEFGNVDLVVARGDDRYQTYIEEIAVDDGLLVDRDIELDEKVATGTY